MASDTRAGIGKRAALPRAGRGEIIQIFACDIFAAAARASVVKTLAGGLPRSLLELGDPGLGVAVTGRDNFLAGGQMKGRIAVREEGSGNLRSELKERDGRRMSHVLDK